MLLFSNEMPKDGSRLYIYIVGSMFDNKTVKLKINLLEKGFQ